MRTCDELDGWTGRFSAWGIALAALMVAVPSTATAQDQETEQREVDEETAKEVLKLLKSGKKSYKAENYEEAYGKFEEAYDKWPKAPIQARLGKAAEQLGNDSKALEHYRIYLEEKPDGEMADDIKANMTALAEKTPAVVKIDSNPSGATVYSGGAEGTKLGTTPLETEVEAGERTFLFKNEGYESTARTLELTGGEQQSVSVKLTETTEEPEPLAEPGGASDVGGASTGNSGMASWGWISSGVGLAGLGTGVAFTILKDNEIENANDANTRVKFEAAKDSANDHHRRSLIAYSVGGSLTAVGAGLLLSHYLSKGSTTGRAANRDFQIGLGITPEGSWAGVRGEF